MIEVDVLISAEQIIHTTLGIYQLGTDLGSQNIPADVQASFPIATVHSGAAMSMAAAKNQRFQNLVRWAGPILLDSTQNSQAAIIW